MFEGLVDQICSILVLHVDIGEMQLVTSALLLILHFPAVFQGDPLIWNPSFPGPICGPELNRIIIASETVIAVVSDLISARLDIQECCVFLPSRRLLRLLPPSPPSLPPF